MAMTSKKIRQYTDSLFRNPQLAKNKNARSVISTAKVALQGKQITLGEFQQEIRLARMLAQ